MIKEKRKKSRTEEIYDRLDEIKQYETECIKEQNEIICSKPAKDINKKLKNLRNCSLFHNEKYRLADELKKLYNDKRKKWLAES